MSWLIFDAVLGIVLVLAAVQGYRKGFVLTLCGFLAVFVAFFGASVLSNALAGPNFKALNGWCRMWQAISPKAPVP